MPIANGVDAAVFVFAEDDQVWYRQDVLAAPRDNVIFEYGLFAGILGPHRVAICRAGNPKDPTDLRGLNFVDIGENSRQGANLKLNHWLNRVEQKRDEPLALEMAVLRRQLELTNEEIRFLRNSNVDLLARVETKEDLSNYSLQWKGLFNFAFMRELTERILRSFHGAAEFATFLEENEIAGVERVHDDQWGNPYRHAFLVRKLFRSMRCYEPPKNFAKFIDALPDDTREAILSIKVQFDD